MERDKAREVVTDALRLARERLTGTLEEKAIWRERIADLIARMQPGEGFRPTTDDLREVLGDSDAEVRAAIEACTRAG
jgi:hypothetical protein